MLVYGVLSPHPPIILPEIGKAQLPKVKNTIDALKQAAKKLEQKKPEKIIIISPHQEHGFYVPLYYLGKNLSEDIEIERILVTNPSYEYYAKLGEETAQKIKDDAKKITIIASGDLSHVLAKNGPYGYNPAGPKLDKIIIGAIKNRDLDALLKIGPQILDEGAECGLRSIIFLMSAFSETNYESEVLSYEGPFGVGYAVATFTPREER